MRSKFKKQRCKELNLCKKKLNNDQTSVWKRRRIKLVQAYAEKLKITNYDLDEI